MKTTVIVGLVLPMLVTLALGCKKEEPRPSPSGASQPAVVSPEQSPVYGGIYKEGMYKDYDNFDPHVQSGGGYLHVVGRIYSGLLKYANDPVFRVNEIQCDLCETWDQPDSSTYVFRLRKGVRFHDVSPVNGRELTADDVKYSFQRAATEDPKFLWRGHFSSVSEIQTPDKYTVIIKMKEPSAPFLSYLASGWAVTVPRECVQAESDGILKNCNVGTGPFIFKEWTPGVAVRLVKNPNYFLQGRPYLDELDIVPIPDNKARFDAFRSKTISDPGYFMTAREAKIVKDQYQDLACEGSPSLSAASLGFNLVKSPFEKIQVRRAFHLALDRQAMIDALSSGQGKANYWLPWGLEDWTISQEDLLRRPGYRQPKAQDIEEAKRLLAQVGLQDGLSFNLSVSKLGQLPDMATLIKEDLRKINVTVNIQIQETAVFNKARLEKSFEANLGYDLSPNLPEPDDVVTRFHSRSPKDYFSYSNPRMDELVVQEQSTVNTKERQKVFQEIFKVLDEDLPALPTYSDFTYRCWDKRVHNVRAEPRYGHLLRWASDYWMSR